MTAPLHRVSSKSVLATPSCPAIMSARDRATVQISLGGRCTPLRGVALIDAEDVERTAGYSWYLSSKGYARAATSGVLLHRVIMEPPEGMVVDHISGDKLDCRRSNMRVVTPAQNAQNVRTAKGPYRGVYFSSSRQKWFGQVKHLGKRHSTRYFNSPDEAAQAVRVLRARLLPFSVEDVA